MHNISQILVIFFFLISPQIQATPAMLDCNPLADQASNASVEILKLMYAKKNSKTFSAIDGFANAYVLKLYHENYKNLTHHEHRISNQLQTSYPDNNYFVRYDKVTIDGETYLKSKRYPMTLSDLLDGIKMGKYDRYKINFRQMIAKIEAGLELMHSARLVHADIKPENIFLDENFNPFIGDFGVSVGIGKQHIGGTNGYKSPNQINYGTAKPQDDLVGGFAQTKKDISRLFPEGSELKDTVSNSNQPSTTN